MAELAPADLPAELQARLGDATAQQKAIDVALADARRYCGWHVSPVRTETVTVDGSGGRVLSLPTLKLLGLVSLTECGIPHDVTRLDWSRIGVVRKPLALRWTSRYSSIEAGMQHGFTEDEAAGWRAAIIDLIVMNADETDSVRDDPALIRKKIDDTDLQWTAARPTDDERLEPLFAQFRILPE